MPAAAFLWESGLNLGVEDHIGRDGKGERNAKAPPQGIRLVMHNRYSTPLIHWKHGGIRGQIAARSAGRIHRMEGCLGRSIIVLGIVSMWVGLRR